MAAERTKIDQGGMNGPRAIGSDIRDIAEFTPERGNRQLIGRPPSDVFNLDLRFSIRECRRLHRNNSRPMNRCAGCAVAEKTCTRKRARRHGCETPNGSQSPPRVFSLLW